MQPEKLRLFFALPCAPAMAERIDRWRARQHFVGHLTPRANLHLTLAFLGHLPAEQLTMLERIPTGLALAELACELHLDNLACWRGGLLHLAPSRAPANLLRLARELELALVAAGLPSDRRPFRPHLTLARGSRPPIASEPADFAWQADELVLYQSLQGRYLPLRCWPLGDKAAGG
ncbi:RNA 2',3'-cyclic phosphodiesterase [Pseudomonas sp. CAU 1711]|uniref:RNA 2',3'-cyclic phosphodiesterase n=1 Tax=Pseudomonas sp. CAU 1711 TaxID=3140356 RepID=UPI00325FE096